MVAIPQSSNGYSKCTMYAINFTEVLTNGIKTANLSWPIEPCKYGWEFDTSEIPYSTIATEVKSCQLYAVKTFNDFNYCSHFIEPFIPTWNK